YKAKENGITVVDNFKMDAIKTKNYTEVMKNLKLSDKKTLVVLPQYDATIYLSSRNLQRNKVTTAAELNTYDVMNAQTLLFVEGSVSVLENRFLAK
ncbi:MAG TPA: 50S ribosomal protein L4, partial [Bacteroidia bacterium]|nr:50S ribosomal protein L4 [Bacteroidia bacterium]